MDYRRVITLEPGKRGGKPCIRGLRITVYDVLEYLASGMSEEEILIERMLRDHHADIGVFLADPEAAFLALA